MATMTVAISSAVLSPLQSSPSSLFLNSTLRLRNARWSVASIRATITSSSSQSSKAPAEFNISFGAAKSKEKIADLDRPSLGSPTPLLIPWIVRGEDGKLMLSTTPPPQFIREMAEEKSSSPKKDKRKKEVSVGKKVVVSSAPASSSPPKFSKAARRFYNQNFREQQRLNKALAAAGVASRRQCDELIFGGKVSVNGSVCKLPQTQVDLVRDSIYVNGNRLPKKLPPKLYFALNKPKGYICSNGEEARSVVSLFDDYWKRWTERNPGVPKPRLFTVGRLDVSTTGLIVVTNDGDFAQKLAHPSSNITKEYIATVEGAVHKKQLFAISEGTQIDGVLCVPESVELMPVQPASERSRLRIVVNEGRHHEVRELVKNAGLQLHSLKRVRIGGFRLPAGLGYGKYVELQQADLNSLGWKPVMSK
ncbi:pseudouridine synthase family protein [Wolffia australiana]